MKIELLTTCLPVEMLIRLRKNGLCIKLNKTDDAFVKWGKEMENYCFEHGDFPTYTAVFDTYPVFIGYWNGSELLFYSLTFKILAVNL